MYRVWEDVKAVVEKKDKKQYDEREDAKLDGSADLSRHQYEHSIEFQTIQHTILRVIFGQA